MFFEQQQQQTTNNLQPTTTTPKRLRLLSKALQAQNAPAEEVEQARMDAEAAEVQAVKAPGGGWGEVV